MSVTRIATILNWPGTEFDRFDFEVLQVDKNERPSLLEAGHYDYTTSPLFLLKSIVEIVAAYQPRCKFWLTAHYVEIWCTL